MFRKNFEQQKLMFHEVKYCTLEEPVRPIPLTGDIGLPDPDDRSNRSSDEKYDSAIIQSKKDKDKMDGWRKPLINYLQNPSSPVDIKLRRWSLKFVLDNGELYRQTVDDLLFKCLGPDQARLVMQKIMRKYVVLNNRLLR
jgi:hypothetical protein